MRTKSNEKSEEAGSLYAHLRCHSSCNCVTTTAKQMPYDRSNARLSDTVVYRRSPKGQPRSAPRPHTRSSPGCASTLGVAFVTRRPMRGTPKLSPMRSRCSDLRPDALGATIQVIPTRRSIRFSCLSPVREGSKNKANIILFRRFLVLAACHLFPSKVE